MWLPDFIKISSDLAVRSCIYLLRRQLEYWTWAATGAKKIKFEKQSTRTNWQAAGEGLKDLTGCWGTITTNIGNHAKTHGTPTTN